MNFLALAGLEIAQDDVELVHELVVEKAQGVQHVAGTGELVGQLAHLRLVVEDVEHPLGAVLPQDGHLTGQDLALLDDAGAVVHRLPAAGHLDAARLREEAGQRLSLQGGGAALEQGPGLVVGKYHLPPQVGGHQAVLDGVEQVVLL